MVNVQCDKCHKVFQLNPEDIRSSVVMLDSGYTDVHFFVCPNCETPTISGIVDSKTTSMNFELNTLKRRYKMYLKQGSEDAALRMIGLIKKKKDKLSEYVDQLIAEAKQKLEMKVVYGNYILVNKKQ